MAHDRAPKYYGESFFAVRGSKNGYILGENREIVNIMVIMLLTYGGNILDIITPPLKDKF
jgi:hypothetical protein